MDLAGLTGSALSRVVPSPAAVDLPTGQVVELPGRGSTFLVDVPGPPGAPTLVLLHALGCTAYLSWFPSVQALSEHYRVVMFDQRWHGRGIRSERFRLTDCADDVVAVADLLGLETFTPVGYSMGSIVAQLVWARHPARVDGLVLCAGTRSFRYSRRERVSLELLNRAMTPLGRHCRVRGERLAATLSLTPLPLTAGEMRVPQWAMREFRSTSFWAMLAAVGAIGAFDSTSWVGDIDVPTSVVVVDGDRLIPTYRQRELADLIPGAVRYEVPGSHAALVLGAETFVPVLVEAVRSVTARTARPARL